MQVDGRKLSDIINEEHENVKYLPGIKLPDNVVANPDPASAAKGADLLIFVLPHQVSLRRRQFATRFGETSIGLRELTGTCAFALQFIEGVCRQLKGKIQPNARALSMIKGVDVKNGEIRIFADVIEDILGCKCAALSGANIANEGKSTGHTAMRPQLTHCPPLPVAEDKFSETTIGHRAGDVESAELFHKVFDTPNFRVGMIEDVAGVSLCGALKNVVAIAAGFCDGLGWGSNAKGEPRLHSQPMTCDHTGTAAHVLLPLTAAIMRIGLMEMKRFSEEFFDGVKPETFTETSAGVADLITTCFGGRNRKCAEAFVKTGKPFDTLERELLNGQKLQGTETAREVHEFLKARDKVDDYPLFRAVYSIAYEGVKPRDLTSKL